MSDFSSKLPVWYQLSMMLRDDILNGLLAPGSQIDPEVQLAAKHGISVMPVRQALRSLEAEGLISRQRGRGTFVTEHHRTLPGVTSLEALYSKEFTKAAKILKRGIAAVPAVFADRFPDCNELCFIQRLLFQNGQPCSYGTLYFLPEFETRITSKLLRHYPLYRVMEEQCGVRILRSNFEAKASAAMPVVADHLGIDHFSPILNLTCVSYDDSNRCVGGFQMSYVSDLYVFSFETAHV